MAYMGVKVGGLVWMVKCCFVRTKYKLSIVEKYCKYCLIKHPLPPAMDEESYSIKLKRK